MNLTLSQASEQMNADAMNDEQSPAETGQEPPRQHDKYSTISKPNHSSVAFGQGK